MLARRGFGRLSTITFTHCGGPVQFRGSPGVDGVSVGDARGALASGLDGRMEGSPRDRIALTAAENPKACAKESNRLFEQHVDRCTQTNSVQGPSHLRCCCRLNTRAIRGIWTIVPQSPSAACCFVASQHNKSWVQQGSSLGDRQKRHIQCTVAAADSPRTKAESPRISANSSGGSISSEFNDTCAPRAWDGAGSTAVRGARGDCAFPAAGAAADGRPPLVSATPAAVQHIKELIKEYNDALQQEQLDGEPSLKATGIRISLQRQGCSGMAYDVTLCTERQPRPHDGSATEASATPSHASGPLGLSGHRRKNWGEDEVVVVEGVEIRVAADAVMLLIGTQVDFVDEDVQTGFIFNNPNQKHSCGCGKSFMV